MKNIPCPLCAVPTQFLIRTSQIELFRCPECAHVLAHHFTIPHDDTDYHEREQSPVFLAAIEHTRIRQAQLIIRHLLSLKIDTNFLFDFGAGRCWFLKELGASGAKFLAGTDTSPLSIQQMKNMGVEFIPSKINQGQISIESGPSSSPVRSISFLDVIEHFESAHLLSNIKNSFRAFPRLEHLIIKVPISLGSLFKLALVLAKMGMTGPLHQLFQTGTNPPHFHYFSRESLRRLVTQLGFKTVKVIDDVDFDRLSDRMPRLSGWPTPLKFLINKFLQLLSCGPLANSQIVIASKNSASLSQSI